MKIYRSGTNVIKKGTEYTSKYVPLQIISSEGYNRSWKMKKDEEGKEFIEVSCWDDKIVKTENIIEVKSSWPVQVLVFDQSEGKTKWVEVAMNYNQIYNLLHRDCSNKPYTPYGEVTNQNKKEDAILYEEELI